MALPGPPRSLPLLPIQVAENAMQEFLKRLCAGLQPCLLLETNPEGQILVTSKVFAAANDCKPYHRHPRPLFPYHAQVLPCHLPRAHRNSPSRQRRRERRAKARQEQPAETGAAQAVEQAEQAAEQDDQAAAIAPQFLPPLTAEKTAAPINAPENVAEIDDIDIVATETYLPKLHSSDLSRQKTVHHLRQAQSLPTAAQVAPLHPVLGAVQAHPHERGQVNDEICHDQAFYGFLEQQRREKENQIRELTTKMNFGFTPKHSKKPF